MTTIKIGIPPFQIEIPIGDVIKVGKGVKQLFNRNTANGKGLNVVTNTIFDSKKSHTEFDFLGKQGQFWSNEVNSWAGPKGLGKLKVKITPEGTVLNLHRTNTEGRFEIWFTKCCYENNERDFIPKDEYISGHRKIKFSCEAKVTEGEHKLRFVIKDKNRGAWLANDTEIIKTNKWSLIEMYFQVSPTGIFNSE